MNKNLEYSINPLIRSIGKNTCEFTEADIIRYVIDNDIRIVNFRYPAADGELKTLNFPVTDLAYLESILTYGERVDGSSLFPYIQADSSDLYVVPRFRTAYLDPFAEIPTIGLLCSYFTKDGQPLETSPQYILHKASKAFHDGTGYSFQAMGELEFYVIGDPVTYYPIRDQKGYHESTPFGKHEDFRCEAMKMIAEAGGRIKYGHCEVGDFESGGRNYEQNEIEFLVDDVESAADQLLLAKWILRTLSYKYGMEVSFSPKIVEGKAGSGLHFHARIMDGEKPAMVSEGKLSVQARKVIAGYMKCAAALTAFGNRVPESYFRLVPHQEAPTVICWGDRNRSVLVRVPLGWYGEGNMVSKANPLESGEKYSMHDKQTVELRSADGSADIYLMLAGLVTAARIGFESGDAEKIAEETYVNGNINAPENADKLAKLKRLPVSCRESADALEENRNLFEAGNIFPSSLIDSIIDELRNK
ncbi:MAG: glutamine synthetase family protein [Bacteroidales bacterium]|jgi:glutamine synthetase|nr:glutamine synthetase family protein [Bacteroidales bacterium]MCI2121812.1 glutamine synthetase family protein [Bacteroidales bacterium]MCI2144662.1 glutamine synthetase family protein [Bacteroidales bacterium]